MIAVTSKKIFFRLGSGLLVLFILVQGRAILVPMVVALLLSMILHPVACRIEGWGIARLWSLILTFLATTLLVLGIIFLFSTQIGALTGDLDGFLDKLSKTANSLVDMINKNSPLQLELRFSDLVNEEWLLQSGAPIISDTISITGTVFSGLILVTIYSFLILLYRRGIFQSLVSFMASKNRESFSRLLVEIKSIGQKYILGIGTLILLLAFLYSLTLWMFGLDYPLLFGLLAASLAIVPYVGTTLGAAIPVIFAYYSHDSIWYAVGIMLTFMAIQFVEGNLLTPKIVGGAMNLNALASIFALFLGYFIWGISGMILFLPLMAIFKIICEHVEVLNPLGALLSEDIK